MKKMFLAIAIALLGCEPICNAQKKVVEVNPDGPYAIESALQEARLARLHGEATEAEIRLSAGVYRLNQPIILRPEDSHTRIVGTTNTLISGGLKINGWKKQGKVWTADVPTFNGRPIVVRQMWVDGQKAVRARNVQNFDQMNRILSVDRKQGIIYVPATKDIKDIVGVRDAEMVLHEMWCVAFLRIKDIRIIADSAAITFHDPESHVHFMHPWPSPMTNTQGRNSAFYIVGAKKHLDTLGEWYYDEKNCKIFYMPRAGEDMTSADVEIPVLENLLTVCGTPDEPVKNVCLENVEFSYATWLRPSFAGHAPLQAGMYMTEAYKIRPQIKRPNGDHGLDNQGWVGRPLSAVDIRCANGVIVQSCRVDRCASTGVDVGTYTENCVISDCVISDLGGNGIVAGSFGGEYHEAHLPYEPLDRRETCRNLLITHNYITDVSNEDWGTTGICAGYVRGIRIVENEVSEVSYTGISLGWGWNQQPSTMADNLVRGNRIHHYAKHMYDTAGIYTLGSQPHTTIEGNVVSDIYSPSYAHDPEHWFYLYTDEGSSGITMRNNHTPSEKYLKNSCGPGNVWENNGPAVADSIAAKAWKYVK